VTVGIRPERVQIEGAAGIVVEGALESIENLGHERLCFFVTGLGRIIARSADNAAGVAPGEKTRLALPVDKLHVFDRQSGLRKDSKMVVALAA